MIKIDHFQKRPGGTEFERLQVETSEFDVFYFYLKELLDVVDEMEKSIKNKSE